MSESNLHREDKGFALLEAAIAKEQSGAQRVRSYSARVRAGILFTTVFALTAIAAITTREWIRGGSWSHALPMFASGTLVGVVAVWRIAYDPALRENTQTQTQRQLRGLRFLLLAALAMAGCAHIWNATDGVRWTGACVVMGLSLGGAAALVSRVCARRPSWVVDAAVGGATTWMGLEMACGEMSFLHRMVEHMMPVGAVCMLAYALHTRARIGGKRT